MSQPNPPELKPCPFCGAAAGISIEDDATEAVVHCTGSCEPAPEVHASTDSAEYKNESWAIAVWNTRTPHVARCDDPYCAEQVCVTADATARPTLSDAGLEAIRLRAEAATPGPWVSTGCKVDQFGEHPDGNRLLSGDNAHGDDDYSNFTASDCAFIAHARTDISTLLSALEQSRNLLTEVARSGVEHEARDYVTVQIPKSVWALLGKPALTEPESLKS